MVDHVRGAAALAAVAVVFLLVGCPKKGTDSGIATADGGPGTDAGTDAAPSLDAGLMGAKRGDYIVNHLATCGMCHSPADMNGVPIPGMELSGVSCLFDIDPDPTLGCISSRNLTNDPVGLMNRTDDEIKDMFLDGVRPNGAFLNPVMPYWEFHNMTADDADAIVAYLRTVPGVSNVPTPNQPPWDVVAAPAPPLVLTDIPAAPARDASAANGRYLASVLANCIDCHTREAVGAGPEKIDTTAFFQGGREFPAASLGLPVPPYPAIIYTWNLTPHASGIGGRTPAVIADEIRLGVDPGGNGICRPMPVAPGFFGGMTLGDATDIANYLLSLAPVDNPVPNGCVAP